MQLFSCRCPFMHSLLRKDISTTWRAMIDPAKDIRKDHDWTCTRAKSRFPASILPAPIAAMNILRALQQGPGVGDLPNAVQRSARETSPKTDRPPTRRHIVKMWITSKSQVEKKPPQLHLGSTREVIHSPIAQQLSKIAKTLRPSMMVSYFRQAWCEFISKANTRFDYESGTPDWIMAAPIF